MLFFLALISVNLAVLNFLPLPIVDGGLMLYLIYEKFKGPSSVDRVPEWCGACWPPAYWLAVLDHLLQRHSEAGELNTRPLALVTGGGSGIGRATAQALAPRWLARCN